VYEAVSTKSISDPNLFEEYPKVTDIDNGYLFTFPDRTYRALEMNLQGLSRLKINLKVTQKKPAPSEAEAFHIDTLDLYLDRARERFVQVAAERLNAEQDVLMQEMYTLVEKLDKRRIELLETKAPSADAPAMTKEEQEEALAFLRSPDLIERIQKDFDACGFIGEQIPRLFGYIATISRFLEKPLGLLIVSRSAAGKSQLQDVITNFVPLEQLKKYTRATGQSFFYQETESLQYKVIALAEEEGARDALYSIRTLQSDQYLTVAVTITDQKSGNKSTKEFLVKGPVVIMITTTNPEALDFETRNRFVILTIDESREQTRRILEKQREQESLEGLIQTSSEEMILRKHHNAQRLLRRLKVVNPYAGELTYPDDKLLMRREQKKYLTLIKTIAFLHQYERDVKKVKGPGGKLMEYIEVIPEDIALANKLAAEVLGRSLDELSPHTRNLLREIKSMVDARAAKEKKKPEEMLFSRRDIREYAGWSYWQVYDHIKPLLDMEYLVLHSENRNRPMYRLLWKGEGTDGQRFLMGLINPESLKMKRALPPKR
jgi:hypothetical protein